MAVPETYEHWLAVTCSGLLDDLEERMKREPYLAQIRELEDSSPCFGYRDLWWALLSAYESPKLTSAWFRYFHSGGPLPRTRRVATMIEPIVFFFPPEYYEREPLDLDYEFDFRGIVRPRFRSVTVSANHPCYF